MGGKKRKKGVSTDTSGTDLDSSDTAVKRQDNDMEVSGAILDRLKAIEEKLEDNKSVLSAKIVEDIGKLRTEIFDFEERKRSSEQETSEIRADVCGVARGYSSAWGNS